MLKSIINSILFFNIASSSGLKFVNTYSTMNINESSPYRFTPQESFYYLNIYADWIRKCSIVSKNLSGGEILLSLRSYFNMHIKLTCSWECTHYIDKSSWFYYFIDIFTIQDNTYYNNANNFRIFKRKKTIWIFEKFLNRCL